MFLPEKDFESSIVPAKLGAFEIEMIIWQPSALGATNWPFDDILVNWGIYNNTLGITSLQSRNLIASRAIGDHVPKARKQSNHLLSALVLKWTIEFHHSRNEHVENIPVDMVERGKIYMNERWYNWALQIQSFQEQFDRGAASTIWTDGGCNHAANLRRKNNSKPSLVELVGIVIPLRAHEKKEWSKQQSTHHSAANQSRQPIQLLVRLSRLRGAVKYPHDFGEHIWVEQAPCLEISGYYN